MKKIYYLFSVVFAWFSTSMLYAQEKTADVLAHFSSEAPVHWAVPTNEGRLDLEWLVILELFNSVFSGGELSGSLLVRKNQTTDIIANRLEIPNSHIENPGFPDFVEMVQ